MSKISEKFDIRVPTTITITLVSSFAAAANPEDVPFSPAVGSPELVTVGTGLFAVVVTIMLLGFLYSRSKGIYGKANNVINIVAVQSLGPKEKIVLVEVAEKQLMLGMTSSQVQTLHVFDEPVIISSGENAKFTFGNRFKQVMLRNRK